MEAISFHPPSSSVNLIGRVTTDEERREQDRLDSEVSIPDGDAGAIVTSALAGHVQACFREAKDAKHGVEQRMLAAIRQREGQYDPGKLVSIQRAGMSEVFLRTTGLKCRAAEAALRNTLLPIEDKPWTMEPTPIPDLPAELDQQVSLFAMQVAMSGADHDDLRDMVKDGLSEDARERAIRMERLCQDQQVQGGLRSALRDLISDVVTLGTGIMKGPVLRNRPRMQWGRGFQPVVSEEVALEFERCDPFSIYPAPGAMNCQGCSYIIEHHRLMPADIEALIGVEGFDAAAIMAVLRGHQTGGLRNWVLLGDDVREIMQQERDGVSSTQRIMSAGVTEIDALEFYGQVQGAWLAEHGADISDDQLDRYHEACVWVVANEVIKAVVNEHPLRKRPYFSTGAEKKTGAFWHDGIPDLMTDSQDIINASVRGLVNNLGMASGPQVWIDSSRKVPGADYGSMYPWKIWQFGADEAGVNRLPMQFFQPSSNASELVNVANTFKHYAGETSGVSDAMHGAPSSKGAAGTASGQAMLLNQDMQLMRSVVYNLDIDVIEPLCEAQYQWNMLYHPDDSVKGDVQVKPRGVVALIVKEQLQVRRGEFLASTANPVDLEIIGKKGRAEVLREVAKGLDMPVDRVVPSREDLEQQEQMQQQQAMMAQMQGAGMASPVGLAPDGSVAGGRDARLM